MFIQCMVSYASDAASFHELLHLRLADYTDLFKGEKERRGEKVFVSVSSGHIKWKMPEEVIS